jgi:2-oxoglutarate ferredoxin oxidoreductase subunit beta
VPIIKAAANHHGLALIDVISPCVTFNDHQGSTKSYLFTRQHETPATEADFVPVEPEIVASIPAEGAISVTMHDGSQLRVRSVPGDYDPTDREAVAEHLRKAHLAGDVLTGLLYIDESAADLHEMHDTTDQPLRDIPLSQLCPGSAVLAGFGVR